MKNKTKMSQLCQTSQSVCWCQKMKWKWEKWVFSTHNPVREACKSFHHSMTIKLLSSLNILSDQSFSIFEGCHHTSPWRVFCTGRNRIFKKQNKKRLFSCATSSFRCEDTFDPYGMRRILKKYLAQKGFLIIYFSSYYTLKLSVLNKKV